MKNFKIVIYTITFIVSTVFILSGCKKDQQENTVKGIFIIPTSQAPSEVYKIDFSPTPQIVRFAAELSQPASENVSGTFSIDNSLVDSYNANYKSTYSLFPAGSVKLGAGNASITSGNKVSTNDSLVINSLLLNPDSSYLLPVKISSVSGGGIEVSPAMAVKYFVIQVMSPYEGNYTSNGYFYHPTSSRSIDNRAKSLVKAGTFGVKVELGDLGGSGFNAILTVNPATNAVTITPAPGAAGTPYTMFSSGLPATNPGFTAQWAGSSSCNNTYDPATKTFKVRYGYLGGDGWRVTEELIKKN